MGNHCRSVQSLQTGEDSLIKHAGTVFYRNNLECQAISSSSITLEARRLRESQQGLHSLLVMQQIGLCGEISASRENGSYCSMINDFIIFRGFK